MEKPSEHPSKPLARLTAIVTGASRGIGRAVAERLAADGAAVAVNYASRRDAAEAVVAGIRERGGRAVAIGADVADPAAVRRLFDEAEAALGQPSVVVASAGTSVFKPHAETTDDDFDRVFGLNARGTYAVLREAARRLADGGRIVALSTGGTSVAAPMAGLYTGSKAAVERFAAALAVELGPRGITVNVVSPGLTETDGLIMPKHHLDAMVAQTPLGRLGQPADVADVVGFLVGPDGRWITGQNLRVSGGL
jgi:3-oxoacyl-[acyl-carrier protein] reductase